MNQLLTLREVAAHLKLSTRTVRERIHHGDLRAGKDGRQIRVRQADLERYIEAQVMR